MLFIIIPAFNEVKCLPSLLPKLQSVLNTLPLKSRIVVCNDGSTDGTYEWLLEHKDTYQLEIINHSINRGLGETMRDLIEYVVKARESDDDIVARLESDDTHDPIYITSMIEEINKGFDVVIASRFKPGGGHSGISTYRNFISQAANIFMKVLFPLKGIREYSSGFRVYKMSILKRALDFYGNDFIQLKGLGFTCTLEKLVKLKILGAKFTSVPFFLEYDKKQSESKMVASITTLGYLVMAIAYHWPWGGWRLGYKRKLNMN